MRALCDEALAAALAEGASYTDVRTVLRRDQSVATKNGRVEAVTDAETEGLGVRVLVGGAWGFASDRRLTAEAAREAAREDGSVAALGPAVAAARFGLAVLASDIGDYVGNTTRFVVLGQTMAAPTGADKTSLVVFFGEDRPGLLLRVLDEFALRSINLTKIESRPTKQALGEYAILVDCAGHVTEARVGEALRSVHRHAAEVRVLGSYPRADAVASPPPPADSDPAYSRAGAWYDMLVADVDPS